MILLGGLAAIILAGLSGIHFYWALGGKWGFEEALPTNLEGNTVLKPNTFSCFYVGASLLLLALFYGIRIGLFPISLPSWLVQYAGWLIPTLFLLRTLGDFRYV